MYEGFAAQLGESIRAARHLAGLSREEVAEAVGLSTRVYCRVERGKLLPSVWVLAQLSATLGTRASELLRPASREELALAEAAAALPMALVRELLALPADARAALGEELKSRPPQPAS